MPKRHVLIGDWISWSIIDNHSKLNSQQNWEPGPISGGALPLIFCMHVHSGPIYWGDIYLVEKIFRYGISQTKGKCLYFYTPYH